MSEKTTVYSITRAALGAALISVCAWLSIPTVPPFTMQTFGIFFILLTQGGKLGTAAIGVYLCIGAAGLPVFSGFAGGPGALLGPTGGYLLGFLLTGLCFSLAEKRFGEKGRLPGLAAGLALCYIFGTLWFSKTYMEGEAGFWAAAAKCVLPFIVPDGIKLLLAAALAGRIRKGGKKSR